jgi:hypothetical protein
MTQLSRNALVLRHLLDLAPGIGHTKLIKFAYLADLESRRYLGHPISTFAYRRDSFGPFDQAFYAARDELVQKGFATSHQEWIGNYVGYCLEPTPAGVEYDFSGGEAAVLRFVAESYLNLTARELCDDVVYQTEPMRDAKMMEELPMDKVNKRADDPLGFDLERLLRSEESAEAGRTKPLSSALNALRSRHHE